MLIRQIEHVRNDSKRFKNDLEWTIFWNLTKLNSKNKRGYFYVVDHWPRGSAFHVIRAFHICVCYSNHESLRPFTFISNGLVHFFKILLKLTQIRQLKMKQSGSKTVQFPLINSAIIIGPKWVVFETVRFLV